MQMRGLINFLKVICVGCVIFAPAIKSSTIGTNGSKEQSVDIGHLKRKRSSQRHLHYRPVLVSTSTGAGIVKRYI